MIHIATVHWRTDKWVDVQLRYLRRHVVAPYRVYANLTGAAERRADSFYFAEAREEEDHPHELNRLASVIAEQAGGEDVLMFLDGDAFPISALDRPVAAMLAERPLAAVRRDENMGDPQPHPSFCVTTVEFWNEIGGDWSPGYRWQNAEGVSVTDVGATLLKALRERKIEWTPLLRSNVRNLHPLMYGVYGGLVYHHGAGFRWPVSRTDRGAVREGLEVSDEEFDERWYRGGLRRAKAAENRRLSDEIFEQIEQDEDFARRLFLDLDDDG